MPSFINQLALKEVQDLVAKTSALILVDPLRLNSADSLKLRQQLRKVGAVMKVAKANLIRRAVPEAAASLVGDRTAVALVTATDMLSAAKLLSELEKEEKVSVKGGVMDGQILDPAGVKRLASLPGKDQLRGMLVNILAAPLTGLARVISEIHKLKSTTP